MDNSIEPIITDEIKTQISNIGAKYTLVVNTSQGPWLYQTDVDPDAAFDNGVSETDTKGGFRIIDNNVVMPFVSNPNYKENPQASVSPAKIDKSRLTLLTNPVPLGHTYTFTEPDFTIITKNVNPNDMDGRWIIYSEDNSVHIHRASNGAESFRLTLAKQENGSYLSEPMYEGDVFKDSKQAKEYLQVILEKVIGISPAI